MCYNGRKVIERMGNELMAPRKNRFNRNPESEVIAQSVIEAYKPSTVEDMQAALREVFGPMFEAMLKAELDAHLGYAPNCKGEKATGNRRNGYSKKKVNTSYGSVDIDVPRDRDGSFEPIIIPKNSHDASGIEDRVLKMYARGMSMRDIAQTVEEIYGFEISAEQISLITDRIVDQAKEWQERPLKPFYTFLFVDCLYANVRIDGESRGRAIYVILGYDANGRKEILGLWMSDAEGKHYWMQIFDEIKARGVEDILFICMDGVSGLEEGARSIFKDAVVQRCIVHMVRNSVKYIPSKEYKRFCTHLKKIYGASKLETAKSEFGRFKQEWGVKYPGAVDVWERNWIHVEQLFNYGSAVRKVMYTTNAIESVNSSFRKMTKKGTFNGFDSVLKALFLRVLELEDKWKDRPASNWAMVRNQLLINDGFKERMMRYGEM